MGAQLRHLLRHPIDAAARRRRTLRPVPRRPASQSTKESYTSADLQPGVTYYWRIVGKTMANRTRPRADLELHDLPAARRFRRRPRACRHRGLVDRGRPSTGPMSPARKATRVERKLVEQLDLGANRDDARRTHDLHRHQQRADARHRLQLPGARVHHGWQFRLQQHRHGDDADLRRSARATSCSTPPRRRPGWQLERRSPMRRPRAGSA